MLTDKYAHLRDQIFRLSDLRPRYESNVPMSKISIDNYRKTKSDSYLQELGTSIELNGLLQAPGLIEKEDGTYDLIFGQCRVLAIQKYTSIGDVLPEAKIWPATANRFKKTIALIENIERQDVGLDEEISGIREAIESEYSAYPNPKKAFAQQTGHTESEVNMKMKIADAMECEEGFSKIIKDQIIKDYRVLYDVAQTILSDASESRKKYVRQLLDLLLSGKLASNVREAVKEVKEHVKNGGTRPKLATVSDATETAPAPPKSAVKAEKKRTITPKQVLGFAEKLDDLSVIEQDTYSAIEELIKKLQSVLNATPVSKTDGS